MSTQWWKHVVVIVFTVGFAFAFKEVLSSKFLQKKAKVKVKFQRLERSTFDRYLLDYSEHRWSVPDEMFSPKQLQLVQWWVCHTHHKSLFESFWCLVSPCFPPDFPTYRPSWYSPARQFSSLWAWRYSMIASNHLILEWPKKPYADWKHDNWWPNWECPIVVSWQVHGIHFQHIAIWILQKWCYYWIHAFPSCLTFHESWRLPWVSVWLQPDSYVHQTKACCIHLDKIQNFDKTLRKNWSFRSCAQRRWPIPDCST